MATGINVEALRYKLQVLKANAAMAREKEKRQKYENKKLRERQRYEKKKQSEADCLKKLGTSASTSKTNITITYISLFNLANYT